MATARKVSSGQRRQMIAEAAYFRAEQRGFNGDPVEDWMAAEAEVDARLDELSKDDLLERLEAGLATANKKLTSFRRKVTTLSADARKEWQQDIEKLGKLRDNLRKQLKVLREQGEEASHKGRQQAEKGWQEIADLLRRFSKKT
jgi:hypothetical protein